MVQPLVEADADGSPSLRFHTTSKSAKFAQLSADGRCTLSFINPSSLACVVFAGTAERLPGPEAAALRDGWPLFPPQQNFTGWRLRPSSVQVVSIPAALGGGTRDDAGNSPD